MKDLKNRTVVPAKCSHCHKIFFRPPSLLARASLSMCSRDCYKLYREGKPIKHLLTSTGKFRPSIAKKISMAMMGKPQPYNSNEKNNGWKADKASYGAFHMWVRARYGKANRCENINCVYPRRNARNELLQQPKRFEYALMHGKEHSHDRENYLMLCTSCHRLYDYGKLVIY